MNATSTDLALLSNSDSELAHLSVEQRDHLTEALDRYMSAQEQGRPIEKQSLLAQYPDVADVLQTYFQSLDDLHCMAAGFGAGSNAATLAADCTENEGRVAERLADFELLREIGRGGMGVVYEARQISLDRRVAVKLLPFAALLDAKQITRFKNEAQAAAQVQHPNIVPVFAIGADRGVHYYAMQLIDGQPLDRAIAELRAAREKNTRPAAAGPFDACEASGGDGATAQGSFLGPASVGTQRYFSAVAHLGIQAAEALHAAHEVGVVHRDIKPSNLLLEAGGKLWVTDFGLARFHRDAALTQTGDVVGTLRYMSPEQAAGQPALVDQRTDVYSLGTTLYELLCLRAAYPEEDHQALLRQIDQHDPPRPRSVRAEVPADFETVVLKAMARNRDERYATARQLADDLRCVLEGRPTQARPPSPVDRLWKWTRRHGRLMGAIVAVLLLAVAALGAGMLLIAREKRRAEQNFARAQRHLRDTRDVLDHVGVRLSERLADVAGAESVRQELLIATRDYYREFATEAGRDPAFRAEIATAQGKIAWLTGEVGSTTEAIVEHRTALQLLHDAAAAEPANAEYARRLGQAERNFALTLHRAGRTQEAGRHFREAIRLQDASCKKSPDDAELAGELSLSCNDFGLLQAETGQTEAARALFVRAAGLLENLPPAATRPELQRKLAAALNNLAATYLNSRPRRAVDLHRRALRLQQVASSAQPFEWTFHRDEALTLNNLGAAYLRTQRATDAARCHREAIRLQDDLVAHAPGQPSYRRDLAVSYNNLGLVHVRLREFRDAEAAFRRALEIHESLVGQDAYNKYHALFRSSLGGVYNNLGIVLEATNRLEPAAAAFAHAVEHQQAAFDLAPDIGQYRAFLSKHLRNEGRLLGRLGRTEEAVNAALSRRKLWPNQPAQLFSVAEDLAARAAKFKDSTATALTQDRVADLALETLQSAVAAGYSLPDDFEHQYPFSAMKRSAQIAALSGHSRPELKAASLSDKEH